MKLEFFQRKFWTACRQVTNEDTTDVTRCVTATTLLFCVQCTALDGKCSISCDNQVRNVPNVQDPVASTFDLFDLSGRILTAI